MGNHFLLTEGHILPKEKGVGVSFHLADSTIELQTVNNINQ